MTETPIPSGVESATLTACSPPLQTKSRRALTDATAPLQRGRWRAASMTLTHPQPDISPAVTQIQWRPSKVSREPIGYLLQHAVWLIRRWLPDEDDAYATEAHWLVQEMAERLEERDADHRWATDALRQSVAMMHDQRRTIAALRERVGHLQEQLRRHQHQPEAA